MLLENLIEILRKCEQLQGSHESTQVLLPDGDDRVQLVGFVTYSRPDQAITLYPDKPDWVVDEEERSIEITVLSETSNFAEITWKEL